MHSMKMVMDGRSQVEYYHGARTFQWFSDFINLPIDQVNFIIAQLSALVLSILFRKYIHNGTKSVQFCHVFNLIGGVSLGYFCFGYQIYHVVVQAMLCYIIITNTSPEFFQRVVMFVALLYLSSMHLQRQFYSYGSYTLDVTGPLMLLTQKLTSLAFNLHDGLAVSSNELNEEQKKLAVRKIPTPLEYFSYVFNFQTLMSGPLISYTEYITFMKGSSVMIDSKWKKCALEDVQKERPSPKNAVIWNLFSSFIFLLAVIFINPLFPSDYLEDEDFLNHSYFWLFGYLIMFTNVSRFKYYLAWKLSEAVCTAAGMGFSGYDKQNNPQWTGVSNVDILGFEFGTNLRQVLSSWNITTQVWLKRYAYERVTHHKTLLTYLLSAVWHGFYPGYYLMFLGGAIFTEAARIVRRHLRPYFQGNVMASQFYDVITIITTRIVISYASFCFVILHLIFALRIYLKLYFSLHIIAIFTYFALPVLLPQVKSEANKVVSGHNNNVDNQLSKNKRNN